MQNKKTINSAKFCKLKNWKLYEAYVWTTPINKLLIILNLLLYTILQIDNFFILKINKIGSLLDCSRNVFRWHYFELNVPTCFAVSFEMSAYIKKFCHISKKIFSKRELFFWKVGEKKNLYAVNDTVYGVFPAPLILNINFLVIGLLSLYLCLPAFWL